MTTKELENKLDRAQSVAELCEIQAELPDVTFCDRINQLMEKYGVYQPRIIDATGIARSLVYDLTSFKGTRKPQRYQIIKIALAVGVSVEELNELLKLAGYKELYAKSRVDNVILFGMKNGLCNEEIEELLTDVGADFSLFEK